MLDLHGGGFAVGSIDMEHVFATQLTRDLGIVVATPEYRLAPEDPFPAGLDDCYASLRWLAEHAPDLGVDPTRIGVGGQSAGGGLAAATALMARDRNGPALCFQFLGIPELDHRLETTSMRTFVDTPLWHRANAELSWRYYLGAAATDISPYASPAIAEDLPRVAAGLRDDHGVRPAPRRGHQLRAPHDGSRRLCRTALVPGNVPRFGDGHDRGRVATVEPRSRRSTGTWAGRGPWVMVASGTKTEN